jgi:hypothetical protein
VDPKPDKVMVTNVAALKKKMAPTDTACEAPYKRQRTSSALRESLAEYRILPAESIRITLPNWFASLRSTNRPRFLPRKRVRHS